jgi:hypothetical protein
VVVGEGLASLTPETWSRTSADRFATPLWRFILQNIPVFREHALGHSDDIGRDPISRPSSSRKPAMDDHVIVFSNDQARLVLQRRWRAPNQIEQAVAPRRDVRAVLNVVRWMPEDLTVQLGFVVGPDNAPVVYQMSHRKLRSIVYGGL